MSNEVPVATHAKEICTVIVVTASPHSGGINRWRGDATDVSLPSTFAPILASSKMLCKRPVQYRRTYAFREPVQGCDSGQHIAGGPRCLFPLCRIQFEA